MASVDYIVKGMASLTDTDKLLRTISEAMYGETKFRIHNEGQRATGALQAFGVENEKVNKLAQQFQGLLNLTQGLSQLGQIGDALKNAKG